MFGIKSSADSNYRDTRLEIANALRNSPIPDAELMGNLGLYIERMHLSRILLMNELYKRIIKVPGVIIEFGVRWGQNIALFNAFRGMYEPYNYTRRVIGFDTFSGFQISLSQDLMRDEISIKPAIMLFRTIGNNLFEKILHYHDKLPLSHLKKWEFVRGDATKNVSSLSIRAPRINSVPCLFRF